MKRVDAESKQLEKAVRLIEGGKREEAMAVVKDVLIDNQDNETAWRLLAKITDKPKEREYAVYQLRRLGAEHVPDMAGSVDGGNVDTRVKQAYDQAKTGNLRTARNMIRPVLQKYPGHPGAWFVKGIAARDRGGYLDALQTLESLASTDPEAKPYYDRLSKYKINGSRRRKISPAWFVAGGVVLLLLLVGVGLALTVWPPPTEVSEVFPTDEVPMLSCEELIANAIQVSDRTCQRIGSNQVCYGNDRLIPEFIGNPDEFDLVGDVLGVDKLLSLQASPLNLAENLWGVAVFKLQANLEGTVPGQNVTFLVFGNTDITNASGDMSAFYFSTGFGGIKCKGVDFDGLQINTPDGAGITFIANGVELVLEGNAVMTANPGGEMNVTLVTGSGTVSANGVTQSLTPGTYVSVPIDENLEASGTPSDPQDLNQEQVSIVCQLYGIGCPPGESSFILTGPTPTTAPTFTPTFTETMTLIPSDTPVGFIASSTPRQTATPTNTKLSPTGVTPATPTKTNTPTATTQPPPAASCNAIALTGGANGNFSITNNNASNVLITKIYLKWPEENGDWRKVSYNTAALANPNAPPPEFTVVIDTPSDKRTILPGQSGTIENMFVNAPAATGYSITITFELADGTSCSKSRSN